MKRLASERGRFVRMSCFCRTPFAPVSASWLLNVKRICGKTRPVAAGVQALRDEYTRSIEPARALAAETLKLEHTLRDLVDPAYALTPAEIDLMWKTAPPRMPILPPVT
jgi:hypothetical protein